MTSQLREDIQNVIEKEYFDLNSAFAYIEMYEVIRRNIIRSQPKSTIALTLPYVSDFEEDPKAMFFELFGVTGQVMSFLNAVISDPDEKIKELNITINNLKEMNSKFDELNKSTLESLNKYIKAEEFPISERLLEKIPSDISQLLHDALRAYGAGSYTACVCVCRSIIQSLVQDQCARENIKENGINKQIESLISVKKVKEKHHQTLLNTVSILGNRSAHPTTEIFTKEKASLVLNGLMILIDEVFT